jgi:adenylate cyclase
MRRCGRCYVPTKLTRTYQTGDRTAAPTPPGSRNAGSGRGAAGLTGTQQRVTYTCVGDNVNLAAHLEAHTKVLGLPILIDENTCAGLSDGIRVESHGQAQFKTRSQAVRVYSVPAGQRP